MWVACYRGSRGFSFIVLSWAFCGSKLFSRGYFVGPNLFLWVEKIFRGYSWVRIFFSWVFRVSSFFSCGWFWDSIIFSCWLHEQKWQNQKYKKTSQTTYSFLNRFQQLPIVYIRKVLHLRNYLRYYPALIF